MQIQGLFQTFSVNPIFGVEFSLEEAPAASVEDRRVSRVEEDLELIGRSATGGDGEVSRVRMSFDSALAQR